MSGSGWGSSRHTRPPPGPSEVALDRSCRACTAQIFEKLPCEDRLKIEQVCKKWQFVGKHFSWSTYKIFDNSSYRDWPDERVTEEIKPFFDRCGRYLNHVKFCTWQHETILSLIKMAPHVQHLKFSGVSLNDESLKELAQIVPDLKSLVLKDSLRWHEGDADNGSMECFKLMTSLEYLHIYQGSALLDQCSFVQFPPNLKFLTLSDTKNTDQILNWVAKGCKDLKALTVSGTILNDNGFKAISEMKSLTYLNVPIKRADTFELDYVFESLNELRALEIDTVDGKVIDAIARYCKKLEHFRTDIYFLSPEEYANVQRLDTLPNLYSLTIWSECQSSRQQTTELVNRLIANGKLQYIQINTSKAPLEPELLFEILRRCKGIRFIALTFYLVPCYPSLYDQICQVVDEIDESDRQHSEFREEGHRIVDVVHAGVNLPHMLRAQYKWLRFKDYFLPPPTNVITEKWQYGWLSAGKP
ncbi:hypothetical protein Ddc_10525 [Ditylenchus destructor]|nr:hypothetical protein Ddc_10525 [Ditylenchus destructor]